MAMRADAPHELDWFAWVESSNACAEWWRRGRFQIHQTPLESGANSEVERWHL
jgi:hypothetical protein